MKPVDTDRIVIDLLDREVGRPRYRRVGRSVHSARLPLSAMTYLQSNAWADCLAVCGANTPGAITSLNGLSGALPRELVAELKLWLGALGVDAQDLTQKSLSALSCRGAPFHHDLAHYSGSVFAVVWLSDDTDWDLVFAATGEGGAMSIVKRVRLHYGSAIFFDSGVPHAVVKRASVCFETEDFGPEVPTGCFVSFDLPATTPGAASALGYSLMQEACLTRNSRSDENAFACQVIDCEKTSDHAEKFAIDAGVCQVACEGGSDSEGDFVCKRAGVCEGLLACEGISVCEEDFGSSEFYVIDGVLPGTDRVDPVTGCWAVV